MARKLSNIARCASFRFVAGVALLAASNSFAQEVIQINGPTNLISNPFVSTQPQPQPQTAAEVPQTSHRAAVTYQNPFAATSKSPPVDTSLRPGPVSRWRHPTIPKDETSSIKSAVLATQPPEPEHPSWDQLPPAEDLRHRVAARSKESDPLFYSRLTDSPNAIQLTPKPLTQPVWISAESNETVARESSHVAVDPAIFDAPLKAASTAAQAVALSPAREGESTGHSPTSYVNPLAAAPIAKTEVPPSIISNCVDTPEGWLAQAQHAASSANSREDLASVIELCDRGMRSGPDGKLSTSLRRLAAWAHNRRGELQADAGRNDESLNDFQVAISLDPNCSLAIHNRAVTLAQQNQFAAALRDFNRVIELNPGLAVAYRNRAELLAALGRMEEAVADYSQAIQSLPEDAQLYRGRGYAYQRLGDFSKASADLDRAIEKSPSDPDAITQRGNLAAEKGNFQQAAADFHRALECDPKWVDAYRSLAWLQATCPNPKFQNPQQAIAAAEQAAKLAPGNDYLVLDTLAAARASAGQFDQAIDIQQKAVACAPPERAQSLGERLTLYRSGRAFRNISPASEVRAASHETPSIARPSPSSADRVH